MRVAQSIEPILNATGLPWQIIPGNSHNKVFLAGHLVGVFPRSGVSRVDRNRRAQLNLECQIRRTARRLQAQA